ncbi:hypothetical protein [Nocardia sp. NPDC005998]|uniref:hypothetical protein n=1 Tax=Nocardia sp. NPDC005998 TaxID=3156894 RepID=UPI0033A88C3F
MRPRFVYLSVGAGHRRSRDDWWRALIPADLGSAGPFWGHPRPRARSGRADID